MLLYSSSSPTIIYALVAASGGLLRLVTAAEITTEQLYGTLTSTNAALPWFNVEGGSVVTNFADTYNNGQLFWRHTKTIVNEVPEMPPFHIDSIEWCSYLAFSDLNNSSLMGYAGQCVGMGLAVASGGHLKPSLGE